MKSTSKFQFKLLALLLMVGIPFSVYGSDGRIMITQPTSFPILINQSGSYVLTSNLIVSTTVDCIDITADNVTLDLNGHALINQGGSTYGIDIDASNNITIKNGSVCDFNYGIHGDISSYNVLVKDRGCPVFS